MVDDVRGLDGRDGDVRRLGKAQRRVGGLDFVVAERQPARRRPWWRDPEGWKWAAGRMSKHRVVLQHEKRRERRLVERRGVAHEDHAAEERVDVRRSGAVKRASERGGGISSESVVSDSKRLMTGMYARRMTSGGALTNAL